MSLRDEVEARRGTPGGTCPVSLIRELRDEVQELLDDPTTQLSALELALKDRGVTCRAEALGKHRRKACSCR